MDSTDARLLAPWTETCEGCDGHGHGGRLVTPEHGPCAICLGTGRYLFRFDASALPRAVDVSEEFGRVFAARMVADVLAQVSS